MIYLISNQKSLFETDIYKEISFKDAKEYLWELKRIQFDTETMGLDVHTKPLLCYQLGHKENQFVFDQGSYSINLMKDLFESDRTFIGHNIGFDLKYLYYYDIWPPHVVDTMLREQLIWLGWSGFYKGIYPYEYKNNNYKWPYLEATNKEGDIIYKFSTALKAVAKNRLGIELDKTVRGMITKVGLTPEVVQYAGTDVEHLEDIEESQQIDIDRENLQKACDLENEFVKVIAYTEFCGAKLDRKKWEAKMAKDKAKLDKAIGELNSYVLKYFYEHNGNIRTKTVITEHVVDTQWSHNSEETEKFGIKLWDPSKKTKRYYTRNSGNDELGLLYCEELEFPFPYIDQNLQGDLFLGFNTDPFCTINWSSSKQLIPFFEFMGYNVEIFDKKEKRKKKSVAAEVIKSQRHICPELTDAYVAFKKAEKVCDSFGEKWLKAINQKTGRIHADFHQLGTDSARLSCGGGESAVNMQQLPRDAETRACFVCEKGNKFISEDYQSQESRIIASVANDAAMLHIYDPGECGDMHSLVAYMSYPEQIPRDTRIEDIADLYKPLRQEAKKVEFAINYGGTDNTLVQNNGMDPVEAKKVYDSYMQGFSGVAKYQSYCRKAVVRDGYILMNPITGHRAHIPDWDNKWSKIQHNMGAPEFWENYNYLKKYDPYCDEVMETKQYFRVKSDIEKQSINYRIQNRGAMCSKLAGVLFFKWIVKNNLQNKVKICIPVHDEYNVEAPEDIAEEVAQVLRKCMEKGAKPFCTRLPLSTDIARLDNGELPDYWIH
jgi:DNA polymerase I-like protein with 3'-5' exonuclease and polymerase domains